MVTQIRLPLITTASQKLYLGKNSSNDLRNLRYIPEWFIKKESCGNYEDLKKKLDTFYPNMPLKKMVKYIKKEGKKIGEGREAETYTIPFIDNYILRINKKTSLPLLKKIKPLKKSKNNFFGLNFGQPIADNGEGISINTKVAGEQYGINNWIASLYSTSRPTKQQANLFVKKHLARVSKFPQRSFDDLIKRVTFVNNATPHSFDFVNPNNFIIDYKNKKINVVDTCAKEESTFWNSSVNKISRTLCDQGILFFTSAKTFEKAIIYTNEIMRKCHLAIQKYENSYPEIEWHQAQNITKQSFSVQTLYKKTKKILENISLRIHAKHFGEKIENLKKLD